MPYEHELDVAISAVIKSCRLSSSVQNTLLCIDTIQKSDQSPVTIADLGNQAVICIEIRRAFPNVAIMGEEDAKPIRNNEYLKGKVLELVKEQINTASESNVLEAIDYAASKVDHTRRFWIVDPIDGTKGFLRGGQYAIALALVEKGQIMLGVLGCPNFPVDNSEPEMGRGCIFFAVKGTGAFMQRLGQDIKERVFVDSISDAREARFCEPFEPGHASYEIHAQISSVLGMRTLPYRIDSQCKYAAVARGDASIYLRLPKSKDYQEKIWDHAAGSIIVKEAGGQVTDLQGNLLDFSMGSKLLNNIGIVVTNGVLHQQVVDAISEVTRKLP